VSSRTAGFVLGGILAVAIGGGAFMLHNSKAAQDRSTPVQTQKSSPAAPSPTSSPSASHPTLVDQAPVTVEGIVRIRPLDGWRVRTFFLTHNPPYLRLVKHDVRMNVLAGTFDGSIPQLADDYASRFVLPYATGSATSPVRRWTHLPSGALALEVTYSGPFSPEGSTLVHRLVVVKQGSHGVVFDSWASPDLLGSAQSELDRMIDAATVA
jgi:hypothetical protein